MKEHFLTGNCELLISRVKSKVEPCVFAYICIHHIYGIHLHTYIYIYIYIYSFKLSWCVCDAYGPWCFLSSSCVNLSIRKKASPRRHPYATQAEGVTIMCEGTWWKREGGMERGKMWVIEMLTHQISSMSLIRWSKPTTKTTIFLII